MRLTLRRAGELPPSEGSSAPPPESSVTTGSKQVDSAEIASAAGRRHLKAAQAPARLGFGGTGSGILGFRLGAAVQPPGVRPADGLPDPILDPPPRAEVRKAELRLQALAPGARLASKDVTALLAQTVYGVRQDLLAALDGQGRGPEALYEGTIGGLCGFGQACSAYRLADLGLDPAAIHVHRAESAFGRSAFQHAFVVAEMPDGKRYLVDATFRQFFKDQDGENERGRPGRRIVESALGRRVARELLSKGFIELTDEVARVYACALSGADPLGDRGLSALLGSTAGLDFTREEIRGFTTG